MSPQAIKILTKCLIDTLIAVEFTDESIIEQDFAIELLEQISAGLQTLSKTDKDLIVKEILDLSLSYSGEMNKFVKALPENLGILIS